MAFLAAIVQANEKQWGTLNKHLRQFYYDEAVES